MASDDTPIRINDRYYRSVREGQATILAPYQRDVPESKKSNGQAGNPRNNNEGDQAVFYNPIQQYNRDLTVLAILIYGESAIALKKLRRLTEASRQRQKPKKSKVQPPTTEIARELPKQQIQAAAESRKRNADEAGLTGGNGVEDGNVKKSRVENEKEVEEIDELEVQEVRTGADVPTLPPTTNGEPQNDAKTSTIQDEKKKAPRPIPFTILDALSASGLRAIRYAKEIPFATAIVANDLLPEAVDAIKLNIEHNNVTEKVLPNVGDARHLMYSTTGNEHLSRIPGNIHKFDVVDLDPYGTAAPFLDAALQSLVDGGLLCVTCTDAGVWASNGYPEKAFALYSGIPMKGSHSHEAGLRLILHAISTSAAKYGIAIEPLLALSIDFYGRLFVRIHKTQQDVKLLSGTTMLVYNCDQGCGAWETQLLARNQEKKAKNNESYFKHGFAQGPSVDRHCEHCGSKSHLGGPMWAGPLHNPVFVQKILDRLSTLDKTVYGTTERMKGMLTVALEEENLDWNPATPITEAKSSKPQHTPQDAKESMQVDSIQPEAVATNSTDEYSLRNAVVQRLPPSMLSPTPFFFLPTYAAKVISATTPSDAALRGALLGLGYTCTRSHCKPGSFKTNAPWSVIWEIMREWVRQDQPERIPRLLGKGEYEGKGSVKKSSPGWNILKRLRGHGDRLQVARLRESLLGRLGYGYTSAKIETRDDMKNFLQSALYELERPPQPIENSTLQTQNGESALNGQVDSDHNMPNTDAREADDTAMRENSTTNQQPAKITGKALIDSGGDPSELEIVFDEKLGKAAAGATGKLVRYQINPRANWGPMVRATPGTLR